MEIDPDLTPKEEKKAIEYNEGITGINNKVNDGFIPTLNEWKEFLKEKSINSIELYNASLQFYKQLPPNPEKYYPNFTNFGYETGTLLKQRR